MIYTDENKRTENMHISICIHWQASTYTSDASGSAVPGGKAALNSWLVLVLCKRQGIVLKAYD